jgi:PAS domain S-box-containing protein
MKPNLPLATRLTLVFMLFALAIISGVGWLSYASGRDSLHTATVSELHATALEKQAALNAWVDDRQAAVVTLSTSLSVQEALAAYAAATPGSLEAQSAHARLAAELHVYTDQRKFLALLVLEPAEGQVIAASDETEEGKFREDQPYFINGKNGPYVQNLYYSTALQAPAMTVSAPILDENGSLLAVLAGRLNLEELNAIINRRSGLRYSDEAFLVTSSNLFATQPRLAPDQAVLLRGVHTEAVNRCLQRNSGVLSTLDYRGIPALVAYRWLPERGLCLIVKMNEAEALAPVRTFGRTVAVAGGITLLAAFLLAVGLARAITGPLLALQAGTARIAQGELSLHLPETAPGELGQLARAFNGMAASISLKDAQLRAHAQTLEQKVEERTRALQESHNKLARAELVGQIGSWEWNIPENQVTWSDGLYKIFGLTPHEFGATYEAYLGRVHPEDLDYVRRTVNTAFEVGGAFEFESRIVRQDGQVRHLYTRGEMLFAGQGNPAHMIGIASDITERVQAEQSMRLSEEHYRLLFTGIRHGFALHEVICDEAGTAVDYRFLEVNPAYETLTGLRADHLIGHTVLEILPGTERHWIETFGHVALTGESVQFSNYSRELGRYYEVSAYRPQPGQFAVIFMDVTERKQGELKLQESEERYRSLFENMLSGYSYCQMLYDQNHVPEDFIYLNVNDSFDKLTGLGPVEGKKVSEVIPGIRESNPELLEIYARVAQSGQPERFETHIASLGIWFSISVHSPKQDYFVAVFDNITERRQAEAALRESEASLKKSQSVSHVGDWSWDVQPNRVTWSDEMYRIFGLDPENFGGDLNEIISTAIHPDDRDAVLRANAAVMTEQKPQALEYRVVWPDGSIRNIWAVPGDKFTDAHGTILKLTGIVQDITERKLAEEALRLENERFLRFTNSNIVGVAIAEADGRIALANDYYLNILGVTREDFLAGKVDWRRFTPPDWLPADEKALRQLSERGICEPYEKEYIRADGTRIPVYIADALLPGPEGQIAAFILDITERKRAEQALQQVTEDLRRSNAELEQFAYVASHDLQEPLRMVSSYVQLLARRYQGRLDGDADEFISYAVDGAKRMQNLINDLLTYSRVGTRGNNVASVSGEHLLDEAKANLQMTIEESGATITHDALPVVRGDPIQLALVFQNLLGNAIKFRGAELPCIHISSRQEADEWVFSVHDNGIGIDPQFAERIFVIFQRLHDRSTYSGTGIGLAVCKRIVLRHGGRIWVESQPGNGATFYFTLPSLEKSKMLIEENHENTKHQTH